MADNLASSNAVWKPGDWNVLSIATDRMADENRRLEDRPRGRMKERLRGIPNLGNGRHRRRVFTAKM